MGELLYYPGLKFRCRCCENGCCSRLEVSLEPEEAERLGGGFSRNAAGHFVLDKTPGGRCPFQEGELCSIQRKKGYAAKPLSCRIYPLLIQCWEDGADSAELRYLCPGVGNASDEAVPRERIERLAREFRRTRKTFDRAVFSRRNPAPLAAVRKFHAGIRAILEEKSKPLPLRIYAAARTLDFHLLPEEDETVRSPGDDFAKKAAEFFRLASGAMERERGRLCDNALRRARFRSLVCAFLRNDLPGESRLRRAWVQFRIFLGLEYLDKLNALAPHCGVFALTNLRKNCVFTPEASEYLENWFFGKVYSMHFCGHVAHDLTYAEGLRLLFSAFAAAEHLAGGFAMAKTLADRDGGASFTVLTEDMKRAVFLVDFAFSRSPALRFAGTKKLIRECGKAENIGFLLP